MSETDKHREQVRQYCDGNGIDLGSSGDPIVPWAIQLDLPQEQYKEYNTIRPEACIHWRGDARKLPFKNNVLDWCHAAHLIEDFSEWRPVLQEWHRALKIGGYLIIAVPDHDRFRAAVLRGQGDNLSHKHESYVGELTAHLKHRYDVIMDRFVNPEPNEYSIIFVGRKRDAKPL